LDLDFATSTIVARLHRFFHLAPFFLRTRRSTSYGKRRDFFVLRLNVSLFTQSLLCGILNLGSISPGTTALDTTPTRSFLSLAFAT
jgi:hypothetical protein